MNTMTNEDRERLEKMTRRIAALIAKAESTTSAEEAALFMGKAEELMLTHAIDRARLEQVGKLQKEPIVTRWMEYEGAPKYWWPVLGRQGGFFISEAIGLTGMAVWNQGAKIVLYGTEKDIESVSATLRSVWRQAHAHLKMWRKLDPEYAALGDGAERWLASEDFLRGFVHGFVRRIKEARDAVAETTVGAELVLVNRKSEINDAMTNVKPGRFKAVGGRGRTGFSDGFEAGYDAATGNRVGRGQRGALDA